MNGIGFVGAGNMGEAMIRGILAAKLVAPEEVVVLDTAPGRADDLHGRFGVSVARDAADLFSRCGTVIFAVKPQGLKEVLRAVPSGAAREKLVISIAAGVPTRVFLAALGERAQLVRAMPNTPAQVGMGSSGLYFTGEVPPEGRERTRKIFASFGEVAEFPREELLDVVTALSGSGPAYAFLFIEALAEGAVRAGMARSDAIRLAAATVEGAGRMVRETGKHPAELKDMVTSPGGTTAAGVAALETGAFRGTVLQAVFAAWQRSRELST